MNEKDFIGNYLRDYILKKKFPIRKAGKVIMLQCPECNQKPETAGKFTMVVPPGTNISDCHSCDKRRTIFDLVRIYEINIKTDEEVIQFLKAFLSLKLMTETDIQNIDKALSFYVKNEFDLVPVAKNDKMPIEQGWTQKSHKNIDEWKQWITTGINIGVKTGMKSNILILDIDAKPIPESLQKLLGQTFMQESSKGYHYFYKYDSDIPKTHMNVEGINVDIEAEGGQVVLFPSYVKGVQRKIVEFKEVIALPPELKTFISSKVALPLKTESETIKEAIATEDFKINPDEFKLKDNNLAGVCNSSFIKLGGILRKELNSQETGFVLNVLNKHLLEKPMEQKSINAMIRSLGRYTSFDEQELANKIMLYLKDVESASRSEISLAIMGVNKGEDKIRIDKALSYLVKETKILKKGNKYILLKRIDWDSTLSDTFLPLDFKIPYFSDVANFEYGDLILIGSKTKFGKCFAKGTKILMKDGTTKSVELIEKGDIVQGIHNSSRKVLDICQGHGKLYKIIPIKQDPFIVNGEHILCLANTTTDKRITISVNDYLKKNNKFKHDYKLYSEPVDWKEKILPIEPYFIGLWLGDGDATNPRITTKDKIIVDYLKQYAKKLDMQVSAYSYKNRCPSYAITTGRILSKYKDSIHVQLKILGLLKNKHIPFNYKINSRKNRLELLAGLIDSDGYLNRQGNYEFSFVSKKLAEDVVFVARSLGFSAKIKKDKAMFDTYRYRFQIVGDTTIIPTKLKRKQSKKIKSIKNPLHSGFQIRSLKEDNYYGFILDGDHLFLLDSFIVNHNTHIAMNIIRKLVMQGINPKYISLESGSRFKKIALQLGMKDGEFDYNKEWVDPLGMELTPKSVTIVDWLCPEDFSEVDKYFRHFTEQLAKTKGILIVFMQLREDTSNFFANNLVKQFPALGVRYLYDDEKDGTYGKFIIDTVRDAKFKMKTWEIPCKYNWDTKELEVISESQANTDMSSEDIQVEEDNKTGNVPPDERPE